MSEDYKVYYEDIKGEHITEWMTKQRAYRKYNSLKNEKELKTIYAEVIYCSTEEDSKDDYIVLDRFERKKMCILGKILITE